MNISLNTISLVKNTLEIPKMNYHIWAEHKAKNEYLFF